MAGVTYLIRMLPLALAKKEITNPFVKSFLFYVPYACLAAMTFPAILSANSQCDFCCCWICCGADRCL
ncbi:MAG: AzlD domain-containing protein [Ruminococcus sp.]